MSKIKKAQVPLDIQIMRSIFALITASHRDPMIE